MYRAPAPKRGRHRGHAPGASASTPALPAPPRAPQLPPPKRTIVPQLSWKRPPRRAAPRVQVACFVTSSFHYSPPSSSAEALPEVLPCTVTLMTSFLPSPETAMHPSKRRPGTGTSSRRVRRTQGHSPTGRLTVNMRNPYSPSTHGTRTSEAYFVRKNYSRTPFKPFSGGEGGRFLAPDQRPHAPRQP